MLGNLPLLQSATWVEEGVTALISGMSTVFIILIMISIIISLFKYIKKDEDTQKAEETKVTACVETKKESIEDEMDEQELVAVITAAIAASLQTTTDKLVVTSFRKVSKKRF